MNYGMKKRGMKSKRSYAKDTTSPLMAAQPQRRQRQPQPSYAQDTTGPGVMQEVPRDRAAPLARPYKRRPKMNVQKGMYASE